MSRKKKKSGGNVILLATILVIIIMVLAVLIGVNTRGKAYTMALNGEANVTIYKGGNYTDPGATVIDSDNKDLSNEVSVLSNVDTNKTGSYEIVYTYGDLTVRRVVNVIEKPEENRPTTSTKPVVEKGETTLTLKGKSAVFIAINESYKDTGYTAVDTKDGNITKNVVVTNNIDNTKAGTYQIVYTVKNSSGVTTSIKREVTVMDVDMQFIVSTTAPTNKDVVITVDVKDEYMDYVLLPNGQKSTEKHFTYNAVQNGNYTFTLYNKNGYTRKKGFSISNIDKNAPTVSCTAGYKDGKTTIKINSYDDVGLKYYKVNNSYYNTNTVVQNSLIKNNTVTAYDKAGNTATASCQVKISVAVESIKKDGVIITVKGTSVGGNIKGYYFNYTNKLPNKDTGGYLATSNNSVEVVRLQGTTYVWVEDSNGNISEPKTVTIGESDIPVTGSKRWNVVTTANYPLNATQTKEFDNLIYRSSRAAGLYSKEAAATSALTVLYVSSQKYGFTYEYKYGKQAYALGNKVLALTGDCDGFVNWAYVNGGYDFQKYHPNVSNNYYLNAPSVAFTKENGEPGDVLRKKGHTAIIVGKTSSGFLMAEAYGTGTGHLINVYKYNLSGHSVIKGEWLEENYAYSRYPKNEYPSGF